MSTLMAKNWWALVIRGIAAIIFGVLAFVVPGITIAGLILLFGAYALIDGIFAIVSAFVSRKPKGVTGEETPAWAMVIEGIVGIGVGLITFTWPGITAMALLYVIAFWALFTGLFEVIAAVRLRREIKNEWLLGISGVLSILFGIALLVWPTAGALAVVWMIGAYAVLFGILLVTLGIRLRSQGSHGAPGTLDDRGLAYR